MKIFFNLSDILKNLITNSDLEIEYKFKDRYTVKNYLNIIITTNNRSIIKISNNDRRYLMLKVSSERKGDSKILGD